MPELPRFDDPGLARKLLKGVHDRAAGMGTVRLMEVCGTHTMEIGRMGLRALLPDNVELVSGPGCPVCVTPGTYIDAAAALAADRGVTVMTYGDMVRVPGATTSLEKVRAAGAPVEVVTSPSRALKHAVETGEETVFLAVGFETTTPPTAATVLAAEKAGCGNLSFLVSHKVVPPALAILGDDPDIGISGFLLPGHVSAIIGEAAYGVLTDIGLPGVITGFTPLDVLAGVLRSLEMLERGETGVFNAYPRTVPPEGNPLAVKMINDVLEPADADWRGIGRLPGTGMDLRERFAAYDAAVKYGLTPAVDEMPAGCSCGDVLRGKLRPDQCPLFADGCTPEYPVGPCMVSSEGSCAAYYKYERT